MQSDTWEGCYFAETPEEAEEWKREADESGIGGLEERWRLEDLGGHQPPAT